MKKWTAYFTKGEWTLWLGSVAVILVSFILFKGSDGLTLVASLVGVTSLIFNAKGHPVGQMLMVIFSILYGIISFSFQYYGEMITYLGMTMPMAIVALVSWLRNPFQGNHAQVEVKAMEKREWIMAGAATAAVTLVFYFILQAFGTANLLPSTISVTTSFLAAYLTWKRSPYFALVYGMNDVVLIVLWVMAALVDGGYISVIVCFAAFLVNDLYGFINWRRMENRQRTAQREKSV